MHFKAKLPLFLILVILICFGWQNLPAQRLDKRLKKKQQQDFRSPLKSAFDKNRLPDLIIRSLSLNGIQIKTGNLLFLGVAFKKNVDDIRNSPALKIMELLLKRGAQNITFNDPHVNEVHLNGTAMIKSKT